MFSRTGPPRFRIRFEGHHDPRPFSDDQAGSVETLRPDGTRQLFTFVDCGAYLESVEEIPEPHQFIARLRFPRDDHAQAYDVVFSEHHHGSGEAGSTTAAHRDNNMRAAVMHVMADAAVSVLAILGLTAGKFLGWVFMDPVMGTGPLKVVTIVEVRNQDVARLDRCARREAGRYDRYAVRIDITVFRDGGRHEGLWKKWPFISGGGGNR